MKKYLPAALLIGLTLSALLGWQVLARPSLAAVTDFRISSATTTTNQQVTVELRASASSPGVGAYRADIQYDSALLQATACTSTLGVCSIDVVAPNTVRINGIDVNGISGSDVVLGTITFQTLLQNGVASLAIDPSTFILSDPMGHPTGGPAPTDGAITISPPATPTPPSAALTVTNANDSGPGSLRQAIVDAAAGDAIEFDPGLTGRTITLTSGSLRPFKDLEIHGPASGRVIISSNNSPFSLDLRVDAGFTLTMSNLSVSDAGLGISNSGAMNLTNVTVSGNSGSGHPGGIFNLGTMNLTSVTINGNISDCACGGGIGNDGTMNLTDVTISGNTSQNGGGINNQTGTMNMSNVTMSNNSSWVGGGVINYGTMNLTDATISGNTSQYEAGGGVYNAGTMSLINVTVAGNTASAGGGGIFNSGQAGFVGTVNLTNTIVANQISGGDCLPGAPIASGGHNIDSDGSCHLSGPGDISRVDAKLGPLANNGGPTQTHALLVGSPAIDAGSDDCPPPAADQRGVARPQGVKCDIGAFELEVAPTTSLTGPASAGSTELAVANTTGFAAGDHIVINPGGVNGEANQITGFGSLLLATPLQFNHQAGESVVKIMPISVTWGDIDCGGSLGIGDAQKTARSLIGLSITQASPCPHVGDHILAGFVWGDVVWGDVDCNEAVTIGDAQKIARKLIGLPVTQAEGCPGIGSSVELPALVG